MLPDGDGSVGHQPAHQQGQMASWAVLGAAIVVVVALLSIRTDHQPDTTRAYASRVLPADPAPTLASWEPPDDEYFPCGDCHDDEVPNPAHRELEDEHDGMELAHGELWCHHCHAPDDKQMLRLADGGRVSLDASWQLCTQCHGEKLADWRAGVHGKRTGNWHGAKEYRTCVSCHSPHSPLFPPMKPELPPHHPGQIADTTGPARPATRDEVPHERP